MIITILERQDTETSKHAQKNNLSLCHHAKPIKQNTIGDPATTTAMGPLGGSRQHMEFTKRVTCPQHAASLAPVQDCKKHRIIVG